MPTETNEVSIVRAAELGDSRRVENLLEDGVSPNASAPRQDGEIFGGVITTRRGTRVFSKGGFLEALNPTITALQAAAAAGHQEATEILIKAGASVSAPGADHLGRTALQGASENGHEKIVKLLLAAGADVNAQASQQHGMSALQGAAWNGHDEIVKLLLKAKADVNAPASGVGGRTALWAAAEHGHGEIVNLLLGAKADVNAPVSKHDGGMALRAAAGSGHEEIVKSLLAAEADVNAPASERAGRMALQAAAENGHDEIVKLLLGANADVNAPASRYGGRTALQAAAGNGHGETVKLLLEAKADVNAPASERVGRMALQAAAESGHDEIVKLLLGAKADVNAPASEISGRTALQVAAGNGHAETVKLLLGAQADVNAPPSKYYGKTALQAAAENGQDGIVKLLLAAKADANAPASEHDGITALQAAAENGRDEIVRLLLGAKADVNAPASKYGGKTALQAAAGNGHEEVVKLLLEAEADANAPALESGGRTALQAAAGNGHHEIVKLLLGAKADVNAPASKYGGRTALQAAAGNGHEEVVRLLLEAKADANAPPSRFGGRVALSGAAGNGYEEIVKLLLEAKANANAGSFGQERGEALAAAVRGGYEVVAKHLLDSKADPNLSWGGRPVIHIAASNKAINIVKLLISGGATPNLPDYLGETVLHKAVTAADVNWLRSLVDLKVFDIDAPTPRGQTPLQLALEARPGYVDEICALLLARGASTDGLSVDILPRSGGNNEAVFLEQDQEGGKSLRWGLPRCSLKQSGEGLSICLLPLESRTRNNAARFFHPGAYISDNGATSIVFPEAEEVVEFHWKHSYGGEYNLGFPALRDGGFEGWLIGYVHFHSFVHGNDGDAVKPSFEVTSRKIGISWIMTNCPRSGESTMLGKPLRSVHYRGSLAHLSIPAHCVEFFTWLLRDVRQNWEELFSQSESYLDDRNKALLSARGENPILIHSLLEDGRQWSMFRTRLRLHVSKSRELQRDFESNPAFYQEVLDFEGESRANQAAPASLAALPEALHDRVTLGLRHKPLAIVGLVGLIEEMEKTLNGRISDLENRTNQMIEMEFNLVSIYEARRSIEMSVSLKRLSWITFIFLPLMFNSSLFGMNVDLLKVDPSWTWYLAFATPFLAFVFGVWVVFRYTGIEKWIEMNIGRYLESKLGNRSGSAPSSSTLGAAMESPRNADLSAPNAFKAKLGHQVGVSISKGWLKRRRPHLDRTHSV